MIKRFLYGCGLLFCALATHAQTYDVSRDFSLASNPNGAWSYGWEGSLGGTFNLLTSSQTIPAPNGVPHEIWSLTANTAPGVKHNPTTNTITSDGGQGVYPPNTTWFEPGADGAPQKFGVIRLTIPAGGSGTYRVESAVRALLDGPSSADNDYHVLKNGVELFGQLVAPNSSGGFSNNVELAAGDTLDFVVGRGVDNVNSGLKIKATLNLVSTNLPPLLADHDLSRDFALSNPNGVWSYGWQSNVGGAFNPMTLFSSGTIQRIAKYSGSAPEIAHNHRTNTIVTDGGQGSYPPGTTWYYPGVQGNPENFTSIRFTVPVGRGGTYELSTSVRPAYNGSIQGDTDFHVVRNGTEVFIRDLAAGASASYSNTLVLAAGDTIDFAIGRGADNSIHGSGLKIDAIINLVGTNPPPPSASPTFDVSRDFSLASNPNGPWSYGWEPTLGGAFTLLTSAQTGSFPNGVPLEYWALTPNQGPAVFHNATTSTGISDGGQGVYPPGTTFFQAGENGAPQNFGIIRLTIPSSGGGTYRVESAVRSHLDGPSSGDSDYHVLRNGTELFGQVINANSAGGYSNVVALVASDTLDFVVGRGPDGLGSALKIRATVDFVSTNLPPPPPPPVADYNLSRDFALANPNGVWSYGWQSTVGGAFNPMTLFSSGVIERIAKYSGSAPEIAHNHTTSTIVTDGGQGNYPPGTTWYYPGVQGNPENFTSIRFTVPVGRAGTYDVVTAVRPAYNGSIQGDTDFHVVRNGTEVFVRDLAAGASANYSNTLVLAAGDTIDFVIGRGADNSIHGSGLKIDALIDLIGTNQPPPPPPPPPIADYDLSRDFALANPNGVWSYGWKTTLGGSFNLLTLFSSGTIERIAKYSGSAPEIAHNHTTSTIVTDGGQGNYPPGTTWYYPGVQGNPENFTSIRFTVPAGGGGTYDVSTSVRPAYNGSVQGDTDFHVLRNGVELFGRALAAGASASYSNTLALAAGDSIDFAIGRGADNSIHGSGLKIDALINLVGTNQPPPPPPAADYDLSRDFALANPNGVWSYGWQSNVGGAFNPLTLFSSGTIERIAKYPGSAPEIAHNHTTSTIITDGGQGNYPPGTTWYYAGVQGNPENFTSIRFTVPAGGAGTYDVSTSVRPAYNGSVQGDTDFHVVHNGTEVFGRALAAGESANYSNTLALAEGDAIDFTIGRGADNSIHGSGLKIDALINLVGTNQPPPPRPPVAKAVISPVVDLSPKLTNLLVLSVNGTTAAVTLDGSQSSDPESGTLTYQWFVNGGGSPVASGVTANVSLAVGSHEITLVVSDGRQTDSDTVEVEVITIDDMLSILVVLVDESGLPRKNSRPLITTLKQAQNATDGDRAHVAIRKLEQFQEKVAAQIVPINAECAELLIDAAQKVIDALSATP